MKRDSISEVSIDDQGRVRVVAASAEFPYVYLEAMEVHWDHATRSLFSPVPRQWTQVRWFQQILAAAYAQGFELSIGPMTQWKNVDASLRALMAAETKPPGWLNEASRMTDSGLARKFLHDHFTASAALIALMLKNLPDEVRTRIMDAVRNGTGKVELRTRVESSETELVLVPVDGSEPLWLTPTG